MCVTFIRHFMAALAKFIEQTHALQCHSAVGHTSCISILSQI